MGKPCHSLLKGSMLKGSMLMIRILSLRQRAAQLQWLCLGGSYRSMSLLMGSLLVMLSTSALSSSQGRLAMRPVRQRSSKL